MGLPNKILIVDDNVDAADMTAEVLRMHGLDVEVAYGGAEALKAIKQSPPRVIFLDLGMPDMNGYDVAKALRSDGSLSHIKIVALTAWDDIVSRAKTAAAGFDLHITKPASLSSLLEITK